MRHRPPDAHALLRVGRRTTSLYTYPDLQAYRKDRFTGWIRQPEKTGPVLFSNSVADLREPQARGGAGAGAGGGDGGGGSGGIIAIVVVAVRRARRRRRCG